MLKVEETPIAVLVEDDLEGMMYEHWKEVLGELPFDPDWETAKQMEKAGVLRTFGLYRDGELIGYSSYELSGHLYFRSTRHAFNSAIYIKPRHRGFAGVFLTKQCEELLKQLGAKRITYGAPCKSPLNRVLEHMGYEAQERLFTKVLSE